MKMIYKSKRSNKKDSRNDTLVVLLLVKSNQRKYPQESSKIIDQISKNNFISKKEKIILFLGSKELRYEHFSRTSWKKDISNLLNISRYFQYSL